MKTETVPVSCGCLPNRNLGLSLSRSRSKSSLSSSTLSNRSTTPKSPSHITSRSRKESVTTIDDEYREVFRRFDDDNDGKISAFELRNYFGSMGEHMSHEEAQAVITDLDSDGDNLIDFQDFLRLMKKEGTEDDEDLKAAFEIFEFGKGSGRINAKSLQKVLNKLGDEKSYEDCAAMIKVFDTDGKGEIGYDEFHQMMMA